MAIHPYIYPTEHTLNDYKKKYPLSLFDGYNNTGILLHTSYISMIYNTKNYSEFYNVYGIYILGGFLSGISGLIFGIILTVLYYRRMRKDAYAYMPL